MSNLPCADIDHPPWPLQRATADIALNSMTSQINLALEGDRYCTSRVARTLCFWPLKHA